MRERPREVYLAPDDPLSMILEAVWRMAWLVLRGVWALAVAAARNLSVALAVCCIGALGWWLGARGGVAVTVIAVAGLIGWRFVAPSTFAQLAAPRLSQLWRAPGVPDAMAPGRAPLRTRGSDAWRALR